MKSTTNCICILVMILLNACTDREISSTHQSISSADMFRTTPTALPTPTPKSTETQTAKQSTITPGMIQNTPTSLPTSIPSPNTTTVIVPTVSMKGSEVIYVDSTDLGAYFNLNPDLPSGSTWLSPDNIIGRHGRSGPGFFGLSFANFENRIAYQDWQNRFWIADLANRNPTMIYSDPSDSLIEATLIWTPDDRHLLIDFEDESHADLVYHLNTGVVEEWFYQCDRLAISPHTDLLSIWCQPINQSGSFAVLEWGGDLGYSNASPEKEFLQVIPRDNQFIDPRFRLFGLYRQAGWSSDGTKIAFYNPQDDTGTLTIVNSKGEVQTQFPGKAYWLSEIQQKRDYLHDLPLQWSKNGQRLLIFGVGNTDRPCPEEVIEDGPLKGNYPDAGCWQVIDLKREEVIWHLSDLTNGNDETESERWYGEAALSSTGEFLAIDSFLAADIQLLVIHIDTGDVVLAPPLRASTLRWGSGP